MQILSIIYLISITKEGFNFLNDEEGPKFFSGSCWDLCSVNMASLGSSNSNCIIKFIQEVNATCKNAIYTQTKTCQKLPVAEIIAFLKKTYRFKLLSVLHNSLFHAFIATNLQIIT
jgi:hypothetical protein